MVAEQIGGDVGGQAADEELALAHSMVAVVQWACGGLEGRRLGAGHRMLGVNLRDVPPGV